VQTPLEPIEAEDNGPGRSKHSVLVAIGVIALAAGVVTGIHVHDVLHPTPRQKEAAPTLVTPTVRGVDFGSIAYVGSYQRDTFWSATRNGGSAVCLISVDGQQKQMACTEAKPDSNAQVSFGTVSPHDRRTFTLNVFGDGRSEFTFARSTDPVGT